MQGTNNATQPDMNLGLLGTNIDTEKHDTVTCQNSEAPVKGTNMTNNTQTKTANQALSTTTENDTKTNLVLKTKVKTAVDSTGSTTKTTTTDLKESPNPKHQIGINWYGHHKTSP